MYPTEEESRETPAQEARRLASSGMDRRGLKHFAIAMLLLFGSLTLYYAVEVAGVARRQTTATVVGLVDRKNKRNGVECITELWTGYGAAKIFTANPCRDAPWHLGETAEVEARQLRVTGTIVVSTHGTIFDGAYSVLPDS